MTQRWQTINWIKVGPIADENRYFRIQFWPDNNQAVSRGVDSLLLETQIVTSTLVAQQNVGGQGLPALEYLLFPSQDTSSLIHAQDQSKRCEVTQAIANNLVNISNDIFDGWDSNAGNYREQVITGTGDFTSVQDAIEELVTDWLGQLEVVKDEKVLVPLGPSTPGKPELTEHFLSDISLQSIETNLLNFQIIYSANNAKGFDDILANTLQQSSINANMLNRINAAIATIGRLNQQFDSYIEALTDDSGRAELLQLITDLQAIREVLSADFIQALDINIGFNSNDGD